MDLVVFPTKNFGSQVRPNTYPKYIPNISQIWYWPYRIFEIVCRHHTTVVGVLRYSEWCLCGDRKRIWSPLISSKHPTETNSQFQIMNLDLIYLFEVFMQVHDPRYNIISLQKWTNKDFIILDWKFGFGRNAVGCREILKY